VSITVGAAARTPRIDNGPMSDLDRYRDICSRARLRREDGILEVTLGDPSGQSLVWDEPAHRELPELFDAIARDRRNRVMILTGSGDDFCARADLGGWGATSASSWDKIYSEGKALLRGLLDIEIPVVAAVNGPARIHAELVALGDVVLASETAVFQDAAHFPRAVPGDGVHVVWPLLLGPNRGRAFLLTGMELTAAQALAVGVVAEVLAPDQLNDRAWQVARQLAQASDLTLRYSRSVLVEPLRRALAADLGVGLALEGLAFTGGP
jgi:enoyl-CoA hydratase/carnithine racemase